MVWAVITEVKSMALGDGLNVGTEKKGESQLATRFLTGAIEMGQLWMEVPSTNIRNTRKGRVSVRERGKKLPVWGQLFLCHSFITNISRSFRNNVSSTSFSLIDRHLETPLFISRKHTKLPVSLC